MTSLNMYLSQYDDDKLRRFAVACAARVAAGQPISQALQIGLARVRGIAEGRGDLYARSVGLPEASAEQVLREVELAMATEIAYLENNPEANPTAAVTVAKACAPDTQSAAAHCIQEAVKAGDSVKYLLGSLAEEV